MPDLGLPDHVTLSTDMVDTRVQDEFWRSVSQVIYDVTPVEETGAGLSGAVTSRPFGEMILGSTVFNAQYCRRTRRSILHEPLDLYIMQLILAGRYVGDFNGRQVSVGPGDIFFLDLSQTLDSRKDPGARLSLVISRSDIARVAGDRDLHGVVLPANWPTTRLLSHYIKGMVEVLATVEPDEAFAVQQAVVSLVGATLNGVPALDSELPLHAPLRTRILAWIDRNLHDPTFGPNAIMRQFPVSRSSLYRAFEPDGGVAGMIRDRRLERAFELLTDPQRRRSVKEAAWRAGFTEGAQFARFFRERFGILPHEARDIRHFRPRRETGTLALHRHLTHRVSPVPPAS